MRAGELRTRGTLQRASDGSKWGESVTWSDYATVWMEIDPVRGREYSEGRKEQAELTHMITIRYVSGVRPDMRLSAEGRIFKIASVINVEERNRELLLRCTEEID